MKGGVILLVLVICGIFTLGYFAVTGNSVLDKSIKFENNSFVFNHVSFCERYEEGDVEYEKYHGYCEIYLDDVVVFSGISLNLEYIYSDKVLFNVNGERTNSFSEGDYDYFENINGEKILVYVQSILFSSRDEYRDSVVLKYKNTKEIPMSFCTGVVCTLYEGDQILIDIHKIRLKSLCDEKDSCELEIDANGEEINPKTVEEGENIRIQNLTWGVMDLDLNDRYIEFNHSYRINDNFCFDSDSGLNYSYKGNVTGFYNNENYTYGEGPVKPYVVFDYCNKFKPYLVEFVCGEENYIDARLIRCDSCIDGVCYVGTKGIEVTGDFDIGENTTSEVVNRVRSESSEKVLNYPKSEKNKSWFRKFFEWLF